MWLFSHMKKTTSIHPSIHPSMALKNNCQDVPGSGVARCWREYGLNLGDWTVVIRWDPFFWGGDGPRCTWIWGISLDFCWWSLSWCHDIWWVKAWYTSRKFLISGDCFDTIVWVVVSTIFVFTPTWGNDPIWLVFLNGLKPPTSHIDIVMYFQATTNQRWFCLSIFYVAE